MRLPVNDWDKWYSAQEFGNKTSYGYHEGEDLNLKTGGDSDLGQPLHAISDGEVTSVHSHTGSNTFGKHVHIAHDGPWGKVYCHYAHCDDIRVKTGDKVSEGQIVATIGKTGTVYAHLHWAIKLQPTGIDGIAKTQEDLKKWTNPIVFVMEWMRKQDNNMDWIKQMFIELGIDLNKTEGEIRGDVQNVIDGYRKYQASEAKVAGLQKELEGARAEAATWETRYEAAFARGEELEAEIKEKNRQLGDKDATIISLQKQLEDVEGKICIPEEDYEKLNSKECLKRFSVWQHIWYRIKNRG